VIIRIIMAGAGPSHSQGKSIAPIQAKQTIYRPQLLTLY
jgi:hypothetical protein